MPTLRPLRNYDEKDVNNFFTLINGGSLPQNKGTLVKVVASGWVADADPTEMLGSAGQAFGNTVSQRYGVTAKVEVAGTGDSVIGMTLFDMKEVDENGEQLKFNPRKAQEIEAVISGQAMPLVSRGEFLYSGITGACTAGDKLYVDINGTIGAEALGVAPAGQIASATQVGIALGSKDSNGWTLIKLDIR
jgi:hypothetical protein